MVSPGRLLILNLNVVFYVGCLAYIAGSPSPDTGLGVIRKTVGGPESVGKPGLERYWETEINEAYKLYLFAHFVRSWSEERGWEGRCLQETDNESSALAGLFLTPELELGTDTLSLIVTPPPLCVSHVSPCAESDPGAGHREL